MMDPLMMIQSTAHLVCIDVYLQQCEIKKAPLGAFFVGANKVKRL